MRLLSRSGCADDDHDEQDCGQLLAVQCDNDLRTELRLDPDMSCRIVLRMLCLPLRRRREGREQSTTDEESPMDEGCGHPVDGDLQEARMGWRAHIAAEVHTLGRVLSRCVAARLMLQMMILVLIAAAIVF